MKVKVNGNFQVFDEKNKRHVADDGPFDLSEATAQEYIDRGYVTEVKSEAKAEAKEEPKSEPKSTKKTAKKTAKKSNRK